MSVWIWCVVGAYVLGSVPVGVLIARANGIDIFAHGSGNVGATNVMRVVGRRWGMLCFLLDVLKGSAPVIVAGLVTGTWGKRAADLTSAEMWWWMAVATAAVVGHVFSLFLRLRGGKGVATGFGALVSLWHLLTMPALGALVVWIVLHRGTRYVSVASMGAACSLPIWFVLSVLPAGGQDAGAALRHAMPPAVVTGALALLVVVRHRSNIRRLLAGQEPKQ